MNDSTALSDSSTSPPLEFEDDGGDESFLPSSEKSVRGRIIIWAVAVTLFAAFVTLSRVNTRLGVEAVSWDKDGRDYVWSVWWRARNDIVDLGPDRLFVFVYVCLAVAFVALSILAFWLALVPDDPPQSTHRLPADQASDS
jgi:hypothetical protein